MKVKRRRKNTRYRGSQTHFRGHRKRTKGLGNQGGKGMSGSENQKKSLIIQKYGIEYFGSHSALRRGRTSPKLKVINLSDLIKRFDLLVKQGLAKQTQKGFEFNLEGYKVLGNGPLGAKISVKANAASKSAIEEIKAGGGTIELKSDKQEDTQTPKEEKTAEKTDVKKAKPAVKKEAKK